MLAKPIPQFYSQEYVPAIIGNFEIVLENEYDPAQMWLPFMVNAIMKVRAPKAEPHYARRYGDPSVPNYPTNGHIPGRRPQGGAYARMAQNGRQLVTYEKGVHQHVLPFVEAKALANKEHSRLSQADYPAWDRNIDGEPIEIPIHPDHQTRVRAWCVINCEGRFHVKRRKLYLQRISDATMATIIWRFKGTD